MQALIARLLTWLGWPHGEAGVMQVGDWLEFAHAEGGPLVRGRVVGFSTLRDLAFVEDAQARVHTLDCRTAHVRLRILGGPPRGRDAH